MVICGALFKEGDGEKLLALGVKDSKMLTRSSRISLFSKIITIAQDYKILIIPPAEIDAAVNSDASNLNWLEAQKAAQLINLLKPDRAIIDCPSNNREAFKTFLQNAISYEPELVVEHKADVNYPEVSAASILAKVTRDAEIEKLKIKTGIDFGSGYTSDPLTRHFLEKHFNQFPDIFRKSWAPYKELLQAKQTRLNDFRGEEDA